MTTTDHDLRPPQQSEPCDCDHGWRSAAESYARSMAIRDLRDGQAEPEAHVIAAYRNTVYPCSRCQPTKFLRWGEGHWHPEHNSADCPDCDGSHRRASRSGGLPRASHVPPMGEPPVEAMEDPTHDRY